MSRVKTISIVTAALMALPTGPKAAQSDELVVTFATCAGRFSALMEHYWLMGRPEADNIENRRAQMVALLETVMPPQSGRQVLALRIEAKFALSRLLSRVEFGTDPRDSAWAKDRVDVQISACDSLLLG